MFPISSLSACLPPLPCCSMTFRETPFNRKRPHSAERGYIRTETRPYKHYNKALRERDESHFQSGIGQGSTLACSNSLFGRAWFMIAFPAQARRQDRLAGGPASQTGRQAVRQFFDTKGRIGMRGKAIDHRSLFLGVSVVDAVVELEIDCRCNLP